MIVTEQVNPPVPTTAFDWLAYVEGEEDGATRRGATECEALRDLCEQLLCAAQNQNKRTCSPRAWLMTNGDIGADWCEAGEDQPVPMAGFTAIPLYEELAAERERCAALCDALAENAQTEMLRQPAHSAARDRYFARRDALRSAAVEMRMGPNAHIS